MFEHLSILRDCFSFSRLITRASHKGNNTKNIVSLLIDCYSHTMNKNGYLISALIKSILMIVEFISRKK